MIQTLANRIRQARRTAALSQAALAEKLGVNRSAVAQWERKDGSKPTSHHLSKLALETHTSFEWLATGRGKIHERDEQAGEITALLLKYYAQDSLEERLLIAFRMLGISQQIPLVEFMERVCSDEETAEVE